MKTMKALCALAWAALLLCGCFETKQDVKVAGGDDVPNDVQPLGKKAAQARDDSADWNGFKNAPRTSPGMYDTTTVPDSVPDTGGSGAQPKASAHPALAKRATELPPLPDPLKPLDTVVTRVVDTAKGVVETVHTLVKDSVLKVDSTVFMPGDPAHPDAPRGVLQVAGRITLADTSLWKAYSFKDADGDGFLAPRAGSPNLADLDVSVKLSTGIVERTVQRVAAGADLDFNARGDNRLLSSALVRTLGADTLDVVNLLDADGDSVVLDFRKDTNVVDLIEEHRYPSAGSLETSLSLQTRIVVFSKDSTRNYAVRFKETLLFKSGAVLRVDASGPATDSSFHPGDDALWREAFTPPSGDTLALHARSYNVRLPRTPGAFGQNLLLAVSAADTYRNSTFSGFTFDWHPETPVADGHWPAGGAVKASLSYRAGGAVRFDGEAAASGMDGTVVTSAGESLTISFDRNGAATRRR